MTYAVVAPEHPLVDALTTPEHRAEVDELRARAALSTDVERMSESGAASLAKRGAFTGSSVINPFTGQPVPVYVADYVLMGYGTGAIMAVPAEDHRDWDFAQAYGLPVRAHRAAPRGLGGARRARRRARAGLHRRRARRSTASGSTAWTSRRPRPGPSSGWRPRASASARSTTACATGWSPASGSGAARSRSSTAPTTASSRCPPTSCRCWPPTTSSSCPPASRRWPPTPSSSTPPVRSAAGRPPARPTPWTPSSTRRGTSCASPIRGRPTCPSTRTSPATGCRSTSTSAASSTPSSTCSTPASTPRRWPTWASAPTELREPFARYYAQGMIRMDGTKMSKSKGNLVAPASYLTTVGADALRLFHLFVGPAGRRRGLDGADRQRHRRLRPLPRPGVAAGRAARGRACHWSRAAPLQPTRTSAIRRATHRLIDRVTRDFERWSYNTAVAACMEFVNLLQPYVRDGGHGRGHRRGGRHPAAAAGPDDPAHHRRGLGAAARRPHPPASRGRSPTRRWPPRSR